jgi:hypothetical protein
MGLQYQGFAASAPTPNITIDYGHETTISPNAIAMDETGYQSPNVLANDPVEQQRFKTLGLGYMRMALQYATPGNPSSKIVCGGSGCDTGPTGDQWVSSIKSIGAQPVVLLPTKVSTSDAASMVQHFNVNPATGAVDPNLPNYVKYWIIGNEPDLNGYSVATYSGYFNADNDAMKAVDPSIRIGGGTTAWYDSSFLQTFMQNSGSRVDFVDFHGYPQQGCSTCTPSSDSSLFQWAHGTGSDVAKLRALIQQLVPSRASQIAVEVGEWAMNWGGNLQANTNLNSVWSADVLGNIVANGGYSMFYGTKGNAIEWAAGYTTDQDTGQQVYLNLDDPHASYHGYGMFTGEGLFPGFGISLATSTTTLPNVDVFASDNPKDVVVVNKDPALSQAAVVSVGSVSSGTVDVWQRNPNVSFYSPPVHLGSFAFSGGSFPYSLPPLSVTTFVITPGATGNPGTSVASTSTTQAPATSTTVAQTTTTVASTTTTAPPTGTPSPSSPAPGTVVGADNFARANGTFWGSASDGQAWGGDANSHSVFGILGDTGMVGSTYQSLSAVLGPVVANAQAVFSGTVSSFASANIGSVLRWQDGNNWYKAYLDGSHLVLQKKVAGATTVLATASFAASPGVSYTVRFQVVGNQLSAKVWQTGSAEPGWMVQAVDSTFSAGRGGLRMLPQGGSVSYTAFCLYAL